MPFLLEVEFFLAVEAFADESQTLQNACSPVTPGGAAVPDAELVRNLAVAHGHMKSGIPLIQKIIIAAVYVEAHRFYFFFR